MSEELKPGPCKFCDSENVVPKKGGLWRCLCRMCLAEGPLKATEAEAIAAWNRRAAPAVEPVQSAEPDWDSIREEAEHVTGLKVERNTYSIVVREVRKWLHSASMAQQSAEPVAWTLTETLEKRETTCSAELWFSDPRNDAWTALYPHPPQRKPEPPTDEHPDCHGLDTPERVRFYEHDFYVLSNFSAFNLRWKGLTFATSEHAYHWEKFNRGDGGEPIRKEIESAPSAHVAFKIAEHRKCFRRSDWDAVKVGVMRDILRAKVAQHEYVRCKLLATGDRELVEDSWRDDFWGWGPNRDGQNMLGKLWMELRSELRANGITATATEPGGAG